MKIEIEKSEYDRLKSREEKLMAYYGWFVDKENDLATVEDIINENIELHNTLEDVYKAKRELGMDKTRLKALSKHKTEMVMKLGKIKDELEEENKKLNKKIEKLQIEIGGLMGERDGLQMVVERLHKEIAEQEAEGHGLFDEIDYRKRECKKLKEELSKYKKQYEHSMGEDNGKLTKGGYASFNEYGELMEEDTLQELRDIGELEDDELIYEEGLYD